MFLLLWQSGFHTGGGGGGGGGGGLESPSPTQEIMKLSMVIIVLSQVLNNNLVPDCVRSNLRGSKFKIFLGEHTPTSISCHSTRGPHRDHCHPGQPYHAHNTLLIGQYWTRIVTYFSVVKLWFTLRASARAVAPDSPIPFVPRLWKRVLQN